MIRKLRDSFIADGAKYSAEELRRFDDIIRHMLDSAPLLDRVTFAKVVSRSQKLPKPLRDRLLADNSMVAAPVIEHSQMSDDEVGRLIDPADEGKCLAIAKRAPVSVDITDKLIGTTFPKVMLALARNLSAEISLGGFEILSDVAIEDAEMDEALSGRPDLPPEIARKLTRVMEKRTRARISDMIERDRAKGRRPFVLR
jgi:uncharacterized protein (DUF2336 family)